MAVTKLDIQNAILSKAVTLGNSNYSDRELASDLINDWGTSYKQLEVLAAITFLSVPTLQRLASLKETEHGEPYRPSYDTIERVLRAFGAEGHYKVVRIKAAYMPDPKPPR